MAKVLRCDLRLSDVHDAAETVGREFRKLTDRFGMECTARLVPAVVRSLEWLEAYVESYQHLQTTVSELEMENDTLQYEREQKALLAQKNETLTEAVRELQKENRCLLMEMDELHFKNQELCAQLGKTDHVAEQDTAKNSESVLEEATQPMPSPPPHSPTRVVHLSQIYPSLPNSHSPNFTPSPPPTLPASSSVSSTPTPTPMSKTHTSPNTPSLSAQDQVPVSYTLPVSPIPSPTLNLSHLQLHSPSPSTTRAHRAFGRSSSLSDAVERVRVQTFPSTYHHHHEDMFERSRVTRRLSRVETELEMTSQQLLDLQRSRERLMDENKQLKVQVENLRAEVSLECIASRNSERPPDEAPLYYKEDVLQVLKERNQLKEELHALQEELDQLRDTLKRTATGTRLRAKSVLNGPTTNGSDRHSKQANSVRRILTESIKLDSYPHFQPSTNGSAGTPLYIT